MHEAYYLENEKGDLAGALKLYRALAESRGVSDEVRHEARSRAAGCEEELACEDFARLMPEESILYLELNSPGEQVAALLEQLGLLRDGNGPEAFGVSPLLIEGALGMRGAAIAVTEIDPTGGPPNGVVVLHPGDLDLVRGLIETVLPVGGRPADSIDGFATYDVEGEVLVTLTERLVIASPDRSQIQGVIARLHASSSGRPDAHRGSLAEHRELQSSLSLRGDDLLYFCVNAEPILPMVENLIAAQARQDPEVAMAMAFMDIRSTRALAGRIGVDDDGISFDIALDLDEGHRNLAFNLMRMPHIDKDTLAMVPEGVAFFAATSLNESGPIAGGAKDGRGEPIVTAMDFGREVFGNIADIALYALPSVHQGPFGPMPEVALSLKVNDIGRSRALWNFMLGMAKGASGGGDTSPSTSRIHGAEVHRYDIEGIAVYVAEHGDTLVISPSEHAIASSIEAQRAGRSVLSDSKFAASLAHFGEGSTMAMAVNAGRAAEIARHFMSENERREIQPFMEMLSGTTVSAGMQHSANRLAVHARLCGIPDVSGMVAGLIAQEMGRGHDAFVSAPLRARHEAVRAREQVVQAQALPVREDHKRVEEEHKKAKAWQADSDSKGAQERDELEAAFRAANRDGRIDVARRLLEATAEAGSGDAFFLNNLAWAVLTEDEFGGRYDEKATLMSGASNEASDWKNWYYLDTYAHAMAKQGKWKKAIDVQKKAIAVARENGDQRAGEAEAALEGFLAKAEAVMAEKQHAEKAQAKKKKKEKVRTEENKPGSSEHGKTVADLRTAFVKINAEGHTAAATHVVKEIASLLEDEALALNDFAWQLLTEDETAGKYDAVALEISKRSNELSDWKNWFFLDTYAHGLFSQGDVDGAIKTQEKAVAIAHEEGHSRAGEAEAALKRFVESKTKTKGKAKKVSTPKIYE
ncbi:MAG: hypothetical protein GY711_08365 [bacterium]|nr:hypothetical protein [bacterium]